MKERCCRQAKLRAGQGMTAFSAAFHGVKRDERVMQSSWAQGLTRENERDRSEEWQTSRKHVTGQEE